MLAAALLVAVGVEVALVVLAVQHDQVQVDLLLAVPGHKGDITRIWVSISASKSSIRRFVITEKAATRAFSWLKAATTAFIFKTLLRHYAKRALRDFMLRDFMLRDRGVNASLA